MQRITDPDEWRTRDVRADDQLLSAEKELRIVGCGSDQYVTFSTEVPTYIKWAQSIGAFDPEWIRTNEDGAIVALKGEMPFGLLKLKPSPRKSNANNQVVSYGDAND